MDMQDMTLSEYYSNYIRDRITTLRMEKGMSERALSLRLGKSDGYIRHITAGHMTPPITSIADICEIFNITLSEFFDVENENPEILNILTNQLKQYPASDLKRFSNLLSTLKPEQLTTILDVIYQTN